MNDQVELCLSEALGRNHVHTCADICGHLPANLHICVCSAEWDTIELSTITIIDARSKPIVVA